ncbi:hypothetical protein CGCF413_v000194 [Colletotrichum fructicola]|nr:hypothetical protein CGCF413_v000194 [Colletotrichum fructicola]
MHRPPSIDSGKEDLNSSLEDPPHFYRHPVVTVHAHPNPPSAVCPVSMAAMTAHHASPRYELTERAIADSPCTSRADCCPSTGR